MFDRDRASAPGTSVEMVKFEHSDKNSREAIQEVTSLLTLNHCVLPSHNQNLRLLLDSDRVAGVV